MGRHSMRARWHFIRSVISWAAPWVVGLVVTGVLVWLAASALTGDGRPASASGPGPVGAREEKGAPAEKPSPGGSASPSSSPSKASTPRPPSSPSKASASGSPAPSRSGRASSKHVPAGRPLITRGVTVQVLDTTGHPDVAQRWARRLTRLGYRVVSVAPGIGPYPRTTVFWSRAPDRAAARALAVRFGWKAGPRRPSLSPSVSVHLVMGRDEA